ncbi:uncharacterized protein LOC119371790 isoform X2 [Rhipicephalus sanguineus]|uniref:uncharacterized protein LOC119371790 isoform X1 n=1 Tax=Rhipicephalus sanguineus TaxID=34632 RepID=UPI0020C21E54|nr:uncharacterized protein LOC119371790 isoform X1 [Rhipicephalus sanguineus]XP_049275702.1 uncharacterized protein LOC119371790 isoform X2 [Rhipicephalus sanguineus]
MVTRPPPSSRMQLSHATTPTMWRNGNQMDARKLLHFSHFVDGKVEHDHDKVDKITRESAKTGMTATRLSDTSFSISFEESNKTADFLENAQSCQGAHKEVARQPAKVSEHHRKIHLHFKHHTTVNDDKTTKTTTEVVVECLEDILEIARKAVIWLVDKLFKDLRPSPESDIAFPPPQHDRQGDQGEKNHD